MTERGLSVKELVVVGLMLAVLVVLFWLAFSKSTVACKVPVNVTPYRNIGQGDWNVDDFNSVIDSSFHCVFNELAAYCYNATLQKQKHCLYNYPPDASFPTGVGAAIFNNSFSCSYVWESMNSTFSCGNGSVTFLMAARAGKVGLFPEANAGCSVSGVNFSGLEKRCFFDAVFLNSISQPVSTIIVSNISKGDKLNFSFSHGRDDLSGLVGGGR